MCCVLHDVQINCNAAIFVTMNPSGKDYGGRSKLPDNLKQLFRVVAMSKPDMGLIVEVILLHLFDFSPLCVFKCVLKFPA